MPIALKSYCPWDTPAVWLCNAEAGRTLATAWSICGTDLTHTTFQLAVHAVTTERAEPMEQQDRSEKPEGCTPMDRHDRAPARPARRGRAFMTMLFLGLWAAGAMAAEPYEQPTDRRAAEVLPPERVVSPNHRVQDPVLAD